MYSQEHGHDKDNISERTGHQEGVRLPITLNCAGNEAGKAEANEIL